MAKKRGRGSSKGRPAKRRKGDRGQVIEDESDSDILATVLDIAPLGEEDSPTNGEPASYSLAFSTSSAPPSPEGSNPLTETNTLTRNSSAAGTTKGGTSSRPKYESVFTQISVAPQLMEDSGPDVKPSTSADLFISFGDEKDANAGGPDVKGLPAWIPVNQGPYASGNRVVDLHEEILDFCDFMSPSAAERAMREDLIVRMRKVVASVWSHAHIEVFGSMASNLYIPTSDVDIVVLSDKLPKLGDKNTRHMHKLADALRATGSVEKMEVITTAKVPIIKFRDKKTRVMVDVSFNIKDGLRTKERVVRYMRDLPPLRPLLLVLKYFLQERGLNEPYTGGIGSYLLTMMVVNLLKNRSVVMTRDSNLGLLLIEFFELYGSLFNYEKVGIRIKDGPYYFNKLRSSYLDFDRNRTQLIYVEDPENASNDLGRSSFNMHKSRQAFEHAFRALTTTSTAFNHPTLLRRLFTIREEVIAWRVYVANTYIEVRNTATGATGGGSSGTTNNNSSIHDNDGDDDDDGDSRSGTGAASIGQEEVWEESDNSDED